MIGRKRPPSAGKTVVLVCRACGHRWRHGESAGVCPHPARSGSHEAYTAADPPRPGAHRPDCPGGELCTLRARVDGERLCALRGWGVGTVLVGDDGYGPTAIEIRYLSPSIMVARRESGEDSLWTLRARCWGES